MKTVTVPADALHQVLVALTGPPHLIHELQATRPLHELTGDNPIEILLEQFNKAAQSHTLDTNAIDAERYRWLRDRCGTVEYKRAFGSIGAGMLPSGQDLDVAIDTHRQQGETAK
ncbi:hypothetical protein ACSBPU_05750 [Parapusillimonas sp. JC17]|uniref:hypothetical protein n=1 Tax=Parapusillimonas sp. JC17 TaxID=3445768 RepID=UPI003F9FFF07